MSDIELESPNCPLCGSSDKIVQYEGKKFTPYSVRMCSKCGMSYLSPRPTEKEMLAIYQKDQYFSGEEQGYGDYSAQEAALRSTFRHLLSELYKRGKTGGTLLEIGCGYGYLLDEASSYFKRRVGTDFSLGALNQAQKRADHVFQGGIDSVNSAEQFDCIIATHVIEHVYHPMAFVRALLNSLRPGGCLLIATPDMGSYWRKLMGNRWPSFKLPEHILFFDQHTLHILLENCGVQEVQRVPYPHAFPLPLIASKLGIGLPSFLNRHNLWMPGTTVAIMGVNGAQ